jgi:hypothetical protein
MSQPTWRTLTATDYSRIEVDETGVYAPEMEIAQDLENGSFEVFRFSLDRLREVAGEVSGKVYLVTERYRPDWPHPLPAYDEWFAKDLAEVATSHGTTEEELRAALCSEDPKDRGWAYESIGGHWGFVNLDTDPLILTAEELDQRWNGGAL